MALKEMLPYREEIIKMKEPPNAKTHDEIIGYLSKTYGLTVSKPTVTRFLRQHAPHLVNSRSLTAEEENAVIPLEVLLRLEAEIIAGREEQRVQINHLTERMGGKLAVLSEEMTELEKAFLEQTQRISSTQNVPDELLRKIWFRALLITALVSAITFTGLWFILH